MSVFKADDGMSIHRKIAEAEAAKHRLDVAGEDLADATKRFNEATAAFNAAVASLSDDLGKRGLASIAR